MSRSIEQAPRAPWTAESWSSEARALARAAFVSSYPWPFLVGEVVLNAPRRPTRTLSDPSRAGLDTLPVPPPGGARPQLVVLPVRKASALFEDMITVGRTPNHDLVVRDVTVSKFHAWFKAGAQLSLADSGSHNGTRIDGIACAPRHAMCVAPGARIRFGDIELVLMDAAAAWEALQCGEANH